MRHLRERRPMCPWPPIHPSSLTSHLGRNAAPAAFVANARPRPRIVPRNAALRETTRQITDAPLNSLVSGFRRPARATVARLTSTKGRDGRLPGWGLLTSHPGPYRVCRTMRVSPLRDSRRSREGGFQARPISSMLPQPERRRTAGGIVYPLDQLTVSMSPRLAHPPRTSHSRNRPTLRQHRSAAYPHRHAPLTLAHPRPRAVSSRTTLAPILVE